MKNKLNKFFLEKENLDIDYNLYKRFKILENINLFDIFYFSYKNFLNFKLKELFNIIFPIYFFKKKILIEFFKYKFIYPLKDYYYCMNKGLTYSLNLKIFLKIYSYKVDRRNNILKNFIKYEILTVLNLPLMTKNITFIIDGVEKTVVSKFVRSPGVYFLIKHVGTHKNYVIRVVSENFLEVDFIITYDNLLYLKYKKNKILLTDILKSFGFNKKEIIKMFYNFISVYLIDSSIKIKFEENLFLNYKFPFNITNINDEIIVVKNKIIDLNDIENIKKNNIDYILVNENYLIGNFLGNDIYYNNLKIASLLKIIDISFINNILYKYKVTKFDIIIFGNVTHYSVCNSLLKNNFFESLNNLNYFLNNSKLDFFNFNFLKINKDYLKKIFFISKLFKKKISYSFKKNYNFNFINSLDVINFIKMLIAFKDGKIDETDIFNIKNLNLQMIGEQLYEIFFKFFMNFKKKNENTFFNLKKNNLDIILKISNLNFEIKNFFSISKYCQYLDQINVLSEAAHKRRVTFLGVIGVSKKYSGFNHRNLDSTHFSRICPVETPEGINIGLVNSLAFLCKVDKYNFLIAPYNKVIDGKISKKYFYLSVDEEEKAFISDFSGIKKDFENVDFVLSKYWNNLILVNPKLVNYVNVLPYQMLSLSTIFIPFLENNDSNRALMASNMIRQALPIINPENAYVSTGLEKILSFNRSEVLKSYNKSILNYSDSRFIILKSYLFFKNFYFYNYDIYFLIKYFSSNQKTDKSNVLKINKNKIFYKNEILTDDSCTKDDHMSLGKNLVAAFMPWNGYNFEDSLIVSERIINEEKYTSLELIQIDVNVFKLSEKYSEILTKDVINDNFNYRNLNKYGVVKCGTHVFGGDILIGKMQPIINDFEEIDPNHRFLYSVFTGVSEFNAKDSSFYLPEKFSNGVISSFEIYFSDCYDLSGYDKLYLKNQINFILKKKKNRYFFFKKKIKSMILNYLIGKKFYFNDNIIILNYKFLKNKSFNFILNINLIGNDFKFYNILKKKILFFLRIFNSIKSELKKKFFKKMSLKLSKIIKIFIICKKNLMVGDKMSGRYGNKGVVSKILPMSKMPFFFNGEMVDVILNPLGVPSRMNIGQLFEIHYGFICLCLKWRFCDLLYSNNSFFKIKELLSKIYNDFQNIKYINSLNYNEILNLINFFKNGFYFYITPFNNFKEYYLNNFLNFLFSKNFLFDLNVSENKKQVKLYDGNTGKPFDNFITVGYMYLFKLNHLSEDKAHARSVGPYSIITQQPLKGKSNNGGQRVGEMEAWALEAYGAFYSLQEMFTIKSDDIIGRFEAYKNIVNNFFKFNFNTPETFYVMLKNINSLSLHIRFNDY